MSSNLWFVLALAACAPDLSVEAGRVLSPTDHAHALRAAFEPAGVLVSGSAGAAADMRMSLRSWGREGALSPAEWAVPENGDCVSDGVLDDAGQCLRRVHYIREGLVEWWEERSDGLEHGFTVVTPPPGDELLVFDVAVEGAVVAVDEGDGTAATFSRSGAPTLSYNGLAAWDEGGRPLVAWMEETDEGLRLVVDDTDALGAVTVDPLLTLSWTGESNQAGALFGYSVSSAGDVNGDGYGDVVVGAGSYDNGSIDEGRAYLYLGSAAGLETTAAWTAEPDHIAALFGTSVSSAGDVNGDGYGDVVVGAWDDDNGQYGEGRAYLYLGSAAGLEMTAAWTAESDQSFAYFGTSVSSAGDVNGDGYGDVVVGAPSYDNFSVDKGRAYLYMGSAAGLETTAAWTAESIGSFAYFGTSVSSAGDVNGDGYGDVVVGAPVGRAYLYLGSAAGLETTAAWTEAESYQAYANFGTSVSSAGDVNGDGYGDVVVGAPGETNGALGEGRAYMYLGSAVGLETTAAWTAESYQAYANFGTSVSSAGDVNGDGYGDLVVGATRYDNGSTDEGRAYLYLGSAAGLETIAAWTAESDQADANFGGSVSSAGDVNGDGYGDVAVGAYRYDNGSQDEGRAYLYLGSCDDPVDSDGDNVGDTCDVCPGFDDFLDTDLDGVPEDCDSCPDVADPGQEDDDGDGVGDACDVCPFGGLDADADGVCESEDCDDSDATVYPGAPELCDGVDNACAGSVQADEVDADADGVLLCDVDCDDNDPASYPGAPELCDGVDNACAGSVPADELDDDGDGWSACGDCDDADFETSPDQIDVCEDGVDNDCDGVVDQECAGCGCDGTGGLGGSPFVALAVLASIGRRRRAGSPSNGCLRPSAPAGHRGGVLPIRPWFAFVLVACAPAPAPLLAPGASSTLFPASPMHSLRATFAPDGVQVLGGTGGGAPVHLSLRSWGREGALEPGEWVVPEDGDCVAGGAADVSGDCLRRVHYVRNGLVEWWESRPEGLEQGFTVGSPPPGDGLLVFDVVVEGAVVAVDEVNGTAATFSRPGAQSLYYNDLAAWDEGGRPLVAWMEETDEGLRLVIDDADALGAVTVDPLLTLSWTAESDQDFAGFGSVSSAGDVNGDGYGDVVVGAAGYDNGSIDEGRAYLYLGSAAGLETTAAWTAESDQFSAYFGGPVSSAGDVNGDGYGDVVVGAFRYDNGSQDEGRAYLYLGSAAGLEATAAWTAESDQAFAEFGTSVSSAGDVNGDGYGDVVVGATGYHNGEYYEGRASLYLGSAAGLETTAAWTAESDQFIAYFGGSVSSAGDVNGDGFGDVVVGASGYNNGQNVVGRAYLYLGSAAGLEATAAWTAESDQADAGFGYPVSSAGDVNGDGYGDVVVGAIAYDNGEYEEGRTFLYLGSAAGLETTAAWTAESNQSFAYFGISVSSAGDVNGDGYGDVVVGASSYDNAEYDEGRASLYLGSAAGLETTAAWTAESDQISALFGGSVSSAGDMNGDGFGDVVVGAWGYDNGEYDEGRAYLYTGGCYDDTIDSDVDGVGDGCDACPGLDDGVFDADVDGVCSVAVDGLLADCDDANASVYPGAPELCDGLDNACAGPVPAEEVDTDTDGVLVCAGDCDDSDASSYPGAPELCDGLDNACAGSVPADEVDADIDGVPLVCGGDCDDNDASSYPGAPELCDGLDNSCAGAVPADEVDADVDGVLVCAGDCDDDDWTSYPGAPELCDGIDNACAGSVPADEMDADNDGWSPCAGDCDDAEQRANPDLIDVCGDEVDNDCDGVVGQTCAAPAEGCGCNGTGGLRGTPFAVLAALASIARRRRAGSPSGVVRVPPAGIEPAAP